jgi:hypothetical protein
MTHAPPHVADRTPSRTSNSVTGDLRILVDEDGQEWECVDTGPDRGSYATYSCRPKESSADEPPRQISVPRSWDLSDPEVAKQFLRR